MDWTFYCRDACDASNSLWPYPTKYTAAGLLRCVERAVAQKEEIIIDISMCAVATNLKRGAQLIWRPVSMKSMNLWGRQPPNTARGAESELRAGSNKVAKLWERPWSLEQNCLWTSRCQLFMLGIHTSAANVLPSEIRRCYRWLIVFFMLSMK